jgi:hypothetical protein
VSQFSKSFLTRSITSAGWLTTSSAMFCISSWAWRDGTPSRHRGNYEGNHLEFGGSKTGSVTESRLDVSGRCGLLMVSFHGEGAPL